MTAPTTTASTRSPSRLTNEAWGGFAATLVALPSSIAFGIATYSLLGGGEMVKGALAGVLGAIAMGTVAPIFGGAPRLISAPCAPAVAVMTAFVGALLAGTHGASKPMAPAAIIPLMTLVGLLCGGLQVLYGAVRGGRLIKYIPYPVVAGYLSGVGVLIFLGQVPKFLGLPKGMSFWEGLLVPGQWQWAGIVVGSVTITGMLVAPRITKALPASILGLMAGVTTYFGLSLALPALRHLEQNPLIIGPLAGGVGSLAGAFSERWQAFGTFHLDQLRDLIIPALTLSALLSIDTLKTCLVVDAITRSRHNSNRELVGQGVANLVSALIGGMPGSGTMGPTMVNINSGGQTRLSSTLAGVFALIVLLGFGRMIGWVPIGALAGILIIVAIRMFDWGSFHLLRQRTTILDFCVIAAVILVAVFVDLIAATMTGLGLAILLFIREQMRGSVIRRKTYGNQISSKRQRLPEEKAVLVEQGRQITICELQGSLFFGTTDRLFTDLEADLGRCRYLILDLRRVQALDFTAAHLLQQIEAMLTERGAHLLFSNVPAALPSGMDLEAYFKHVGLVKPSVNVHEFDSLDDALEWAENRVLEDARVSAESEVPLELKEIALLREFEEDHTLAALKACMVEQSYAGGETIFEAGAVGDELFLVRRGLVRVFLPLEHGKHLNLATFGRGSFFGEMAFLDRGVRSAVAVAATPADLYVISRERFNQVALEQPLLAVRVFARMAKALASRLRHTDHELRILQDS